MIRLPIGVLSLPLFLLSALSVDAQETQRPNVLFLICDDLNCDLGCYGHPLVKSPNIDRLAKRGVRFERAYCQYPLCGPSRASFMTGTYPDQTLVQRNAIYIREHIPNVKTLSQMFRDAGYTATRIGKIYHYNVPNHIGTSGHDDPDSWDFTVNPRGRDRADDSTIFSLTPGQFGGTLSWRADEGNDEEQTDGLSANEAVKRLKQYGQTKQPFYLAVGLYRPHTPYISPKKYFEMYPLDGINVPPVPEGYLETLPKPAQNTLTRKKDQVNLEPDLAKQAMQAYYASISFADAQLGKILDALDQARLSENTIVVFTSDHGYHMGEHGYFQKTTLFENATHVPLIIAGPGVEAAGRSTKSFAEMIDFYPTLAELCGLTPPPSISGVSLVPALKDVTAAPRTSALTQFENGYTVRTSRYRYTEWGENGSLGAELYDHETDPAEMVNLANGQEHARVIEEMTALLRKRIAEAQMKPQGVTQIRFENRRRVR